MKILLAMLLMLAFPAAAVSSDCRSSIRTPDGHHVVRVGDAEGSAWMKLGQPDRQVQLENRFGAGVGMAWVYYGERKTTRVELSGSRVIALCESLH